MIQSRRNFISLVMFLNFSFLVYLAANFRSITADAPWPSFKDYESSYITPDSIQYDAIKRTNFVESPENQVIFSQLSNSDGAFYEPIDNVVGTIAFSPYNKYQNQPYVANGYIGSRIPNLGQGFAYDQVDEDEDDGNLSNGWPLFNERFAGAFVAGFYDIQHNTTETNFPELIENGYESVISAVPQWTSLQLSARIGGSLYVLDPDNPSDQGAISNYVQTMSLSNGIVTTEYTWLNSFRVKYEVLAHRTNVNLGLVRLQVRNLNGTSSTLNVTDVLDFSTAQRCQLVDADYDDEGIYINFQPNEISYINGSIYSILDTQLDADISMSLSNESVWQTYEVSFQNRSSMTFTKYVGIATTDFDPENFESSDDVLQFAKNIAVNASDSSFKELSESHIEEWEKTLDIFIEFPDDPVITMTSRASLFHLAANTRANATGVTGALGVTGLSSDSYAGMVFWDTDLWMLNGILPYLPDRAKSIVNYRLHTHDQAIDNVPDGMDGAVYPWTSGRFGNCTSTGPCVDYEYHINMAVSFAAWQVYLSGYGDDEYLRDVVYPLIYDAADFMADYVQYNETLDQYTTSNLTDPDEFANHVDNGAYTNAATSLLMKYAIAIGQHLDEDIPSNFSNIAGNMHMPMSEGDDDITLEYTGMNSSVGIKQADVIMVTYPLNNELVSEDQAFTNMQFYAMKQVNYGPAMTFPIFSIVLSALSLSGCLSQSHLYKAITPYLRAPFAQFLEQNNDDFATNGGTHPAFPFLTAHGGFLQAILQGFTGMRYGYDLRDNKISRHLTFDPISLPLFGSGARIEGIKYMNSTLSLNINATHFVILNNGPIDGSEDEELSIRIGDRNPEAGSYTLSAGESLEIPLSKSDLSSPESICECAAATFINITEGAFGDSPFLINDGDNFTHWQAKYNDTTAKVLVDLKEFKNITGGEINWGERPPLNFSLSVFELDTTWDPYELLASVDFDAPGVLDKYRFFKTGKADIMDQDTVFSTVVEQNVEISAPFNETLSQEIEVPDFFNTTRFDLDDPLLARYLLIEYSDLHDEHPVDPSALGGAKLYEVMLFD